MNLLNEVDGLNIFSKYKVILMYAQKNRDLMGEVGDRFFLTILKHLKSIKYQLKNDHVNNLCTYLYIFAKIQQQNGIIIYNNVRKEKNLNNNTNEESVYREMESVLAELS